MKRAAIRARRTLADGRRLIQVVCPYCQHRHWQPDAVTGYWGRSNANFSVLRGQR